MLTITLSIIGSLATYAAVKSGCGKLSFMAGFTTVAAIAGSF
jgi:hypothetical protein